jgi:hypothetical protein
MSMDWILSIEHLELLERWKLIWVMEFGRFRVG